MADSTVTKVTNVVIAVCSVALTWRVIAGAPSRESTPGFRTEVPEWTDVANTGHLIGDPAAPIKFVIFEDFECPICGVFAREAMPGILARFPHEVSFTFRHYPLDYHKAAYVAAIGAECAAEQQWFPQYRTFLFNNQQAIDSTRIATMAAESGVPDTAKFKGCLQRGRPNAAVDRDRSLAQKLAVPGTPGILVNGFMLRISPDSMRIATLVDSLIKEIR